MKKIIGITGAFIFIATLFTLPLYAKDKLTFRPERSYTQEQWSEETRRDYHQERLQERVDRGYITQDEADDMIKDMDNNEYYGMGMHHRRNRNNSNRNYRGYGRHCGRNY